MTATESDTCAYAELEVTSNYSFLRGASHPSELVTAAAALGLAAIAVTDRPAPPAALRQPDLAAVRRAVDALGGEQPTVRQPGR